MATKFKTGDIVSVHAPGIVSIHERRGEVTAHRSESIYYSVRLFGDKPSKEFCESELRLVPVDTAPEKVYDKDMKEQKIANGTRVHVNAPARPAIHGKAGVVQGFDPVSSTYKVLLDRFAQANEPSFFYIFELIPETSPQVKKFATVKDELTTLHAKYRALRTTAQEDLEKYDKTLADIESVLALINGSE